MIAFNNLTNQTLTVFLGAVLSKRYTNPSSDIIYILAGLDNADAVFSNFVGMIDSVIRNGRNSKVRTVDEHELDVDLR